jgi:catechol 2,3-dioxygenase-like lactoylglutathione lyase family enzyme
MLRQVVLDCVDARTAAEFWRQLLGFAYRPGDEPPPAGQPDPAARDWLGLRDPAGRAGVAFQPVAELAEPTWPDQAVPQQLHLDLTVPDRGGLDRQHERVLALGGRMLLDRSDDPQEALRVYADPAGHPFCIIVAPPVS